MRRRASQGRPATKLRSDGLVQMPRIHRRGHRGRPAVKLSEREREAITYFYANPDIRLRELTTALGLQPGELLRLLRLIEGRELINFLVASFAPEHLWPKYRLIGGQHMILTPISPIDFDQIERRPSCAEVLAELGFIPKKRQD